MVRRPHQRGRGGARRGDTADFRDFPFGEIFGAAKLFEIIQQRDRAAGVFVIRRLADKMIRVAPSVAEQKIDRHGPADDQSGDSNNGGKI